MNLPHMAGVQTPNYRHKKRKDGKDSPHSEPVFLHSSWTIVYSSIWHQPNLHEHYFGRKPCQSSPWRGAPT